MGPINASTSLIARIRKNPNNDGLDEARCEVLRILSGAAKEVSGSRYSFSPKVVPTLGQYLFDSQMHAFLTIVRVPNTPYIGTPAAMPLAAL